MVCFFQVRISATGQSAYEVRTSGLPSRFFAGDGTEIVNPGAIRVVNELASVPQAVSDAIATPKAKAVPKLLIVDELSQAEGFSAGTARSIVIEPPPPRHGFMVEGEQPASPPAAAVTADTEVVPGAESAVELQSSPPAAEPPKAAEQSAAAPVATTTEPPIKTTSSQPRRRR